MNWKLEVFSPPPELALLGILEKVDSVLYEEYAFDAGTFSLEVMLDDAASALIQADNIIWFGDDAAGVITYINNSSEEEAGKITVKGEMLTGVLKRRILWGLHKFSTSPSGVMRGAVAMNLAEPEAGDTENRAIPGVVLAEDTESDQRKIVKQSTGATLLEFCAEIGAAHQTAFGIRFNPEVPCLEFYTHIGVDRSINQSTVEPVVFDTELDDILDSAYEYNSGDYANVALIAGEGDGTNRVYLTVYEDGSDSGVDSSGVREQYQYATKQEVTAVRNTASSLGAEVEQLKNSLSGLSSDLSGYATERYVTAAIQTAVLDSWNGSY